MSKTLISVAILTHNEEKNIKACLESVKGLVSQIIVVDSYSTDKTLEIARLYGAETYKHKFENQAQQFNWALDTLEIKGDWILKLDADEYLTPELAEEIQNTLQSISETITGFLIKRRVYFMGRWMRYGGYYPIWFLRLWRKGKARSEERKMDEHIILLEGKEARLQYDFVDDNQKGLQDWIQKHKKYAVREAEEIRMGNIGEGNKRKLYYALPPFARVIVYFLYRYFFQLGFLDGVQGVLFHFLHGFWYRWFVDYEIYKLKRISN